MAILDRFRTVPRHKHPDPSVRLAYVEELPIDDREQLAAIARGDDDARVRRAAVAKLLDPPALAGVAREDRDEAVRDQAIAMLRDIALEAFEGVDEAESIAAVAALTDVKTLAAIAKSATREAVARRALLRVIDARALGSIARHATLEPVRRAALERLRDRDEVLAVAMNSDFKDTALAALEQFSDRADVELVATRARNKSSAKRARGLLREMDERAAAEAAAVAAALVEVAEARAAQLSIAPAAEPPPIFEEPAADAQTEQDTAAEAHRHAAEEERERERAEAVRRRAEEEAVARAHIDAEAEKETARRRARLAELADEAEQAAADPDLSAGKRRIQVARREWKDLSAVTPADPEVGGRFAEAETRLAHRDSELQEQDARRRREALSRLNQLAVRLEALVGKPDLTMKAADHALRDVRAALADVPPMPSRRDYEEVTHRLKAAQTALTPRAQELREADDWRRFANVSVQEQLCARMEALQSLEDPEEIARQVRDLQQQWRLAADVPRAQADALWRRFKTAHDTVWARCEAHFAAQAEQRAANLARKIELCERAEGLAESTNWIQTAEEIKRLQAEWKTIGAVTRGQEKAIWERFRVPCDRFFTRRHEDLARRKAMWATNFARKEELCVKAEALAESTEWEPAAGEIKRLQAEWKTIGPVKKSRSEAIWQRFRGACDRFFARYAQRHDIARAERVAAREAICAELEALVPLDQAAADNPPDDLAARVRALRARWQQEIAARGVDRERAAALDARFREAFDRALTAFPAAFAGTDLDPAANRKRMETLVKRIEDLAAAVAPAAGADAADAVSPTARLATMLKEALAANTIGGKVDEESRWRAAQEEVRHAQASWSRIGPVPDDARRELVARFERACAAIARTGGAGTVRPTRS
jgi:hypothetical protein